MKFVHQRDYIHWRYVTKTDMEEADRLAGLNSSVKSAGCGLCSAVHAADRLLPNCDFDVEDALELSYEVKANHRRGTDYNRFAPAFAEKLGLKLEFSTSLEQVRHCLQTGGVAIVLVSGDQDDRPGLFSHVGHYMTIIGVEPDGRLAILDSAYSEKKYSEEGRRGKLEVTHGVVLLSDPAYLEAEAKTYYLLWRK